MLNDRRYTKRKAPNKHLVLNTIYKDISINLRSTNSTILLGGYPVKAIRRVIKYISKNSVINGWELNNKTWMLLKQRCTFNKLFKIVRKMGSSKCKLLLNNANVMHGSVTNFEDLDFCLCWKRKKPTKANNPYTIFIKRLYIQHHYLHGYKAMVGTVTLRNGKGKASSFKYLNNILSILGWHLVSIDGQTNNYGRGLRISKAKPQHTVSPIFHAYEHKIKIRRKSANAVNTVKMRMFTYKDTTPMLTFALKYK